MSNNYQSKTCPSAFKRLTQAHAVVRITHLENMTVEFIPPQTTLLYRKAVVCRDIPILLIFNPKHTLSSKHTKLMSKVLNVS